MAAEDFDIKVKMAIDAAGAAQTLGEFRKSIKDLKGLAIQAGEGTAAFNDITTAIGNANHEVKELNEVIATKSGNAFKNLIGAFKGFGQVGLGAFETISGAAGLLGDETEDLQKQFVKLQSIMVFSKGIEELSEMGDKLSRSSVIVKDTIIPVWNTLNQGVINFGTYIKNLSFTSIIQGVQSFGQSALGVIQNIGSGFKTFFTNLTAWVSANPLALILTAIALIVAAISAMVDDFKPLTAIFNGVKAIVTSLVQAIKNFLDYLGLTNFALKEQSKLIIDNAKKEQTAITEKYDNEIELAKITGANVELLELKKAEAVKNSAQEQIISYDSLRRAGVELTSDQQKNYDEQIKNLKAYDLQVAKMLAIRFKTSSDDTKKIQDNNKKTDIQRKKSQADILKGTAKVNAELKIANDEALNSKEEQVDAENKLYDDLLNQAVASGKSIEQIASVHNKNLDNIEKEFNNKTIKNGQDASDKKKKLAEEETQKQIKLVEDKYKLIGQQDEISVKLAKAEKDKSNSDLADQLTVELDEYTKLGKDKKALLDDYFSKLVANNKMVDDADDQAYQNKVARLNELKQLEPKNAEDINNQIALLELQRNEESKKNMEISLSDFQKVETEQIALYKESANALSDKTAKEKRLYDASTAELVDTYNFQKKLMESNNQDTTLLTEKFNSSIEVLNKEHEEKLTAITEEENKKRIQAATNYASAVSSLLGNIQSAVDQSSQQQQKVVEDTNNAQLASVDSTTQAKLDAITNAANAEVANTALTEDAKNAILTKAQQQQLAVQLAAKTKENQLNQAAAHQEFLIKKKQFDQDKALGIARAVIGTAEAVVQALSGSPPPASYILAALSAAAGAVQIATIAGQAEPTESDTASSFTGGAFNSFSVPSPSLATPTSSSSGSGPSAPTFFRLGQGGPNSQLNNQIPAQKVYVTETDITNTQQKVSVIESRAVQKL
jgi:hypothetical protein